MCDGAAPLPLTLHSFFQGRVDLRSPELFARLHGPPKPGADTLADHAALKLGKGAASGCPIHVCFPPDSDGIADILHRPFRVVSGLMRWNMIAETPNTKRS